MADYSNVTEAMAYAEKACVAQQAEADLIGGMMAGHDGLYPDETLAKLAGIQRPSVVKNLENQMENQLELSKSETARLTRLIALLKANPDTQEILELMGKVY